MTTRVARLFPLLCMALAVFLSGCVPERADARKDIGPPPPVVVSEGWVRWVPPTAPNSAAYFVIENPTLANDEFIGASSPRARAVEIHRIIQNGYSKSMQRVSSIAIEPANKVELAPGGFHLMLIGLTAPVREGEKIPLVLEFSRSGRLEVEFPVMTLVGND